jgi:hypothetical protein
LAEEGGGEACIEAEWTFVAEDVGECADGGFGEVGRTGLQADFYCSECQMGFLDWLRGEVRAYLGREDV